MVDLCSAIFSLKSVIIESGFYQKEILNSST